MVRFVNGPYWGVTNWGSNPLGLWLRTGFGGETVGGNVFVGLWCSLISYEQDRVISSMFSCYSMRQLPELFTCTCIASHKQSHKKTVVVYEIYRNCNQTNRTTGAMHESWWVKSRSLNDYDFNVAFIMNQFIHY